MVRIELLTKSNEREYNEFIAHCSRALIQHTLLWRDVIASIGEDIPLYLIARDSDHKVVGVLPAFLFECELGNIMISIPQAGGYGGVVADEDYPFKDDLYAGLLERLVIEAENNNCLLATVCTPPLSDELSLYRRYFKPDFELENIFQYVDLHHGFISDLDIGRRGMIRKNIWRNIRKAKNAGLVVTIDDSVDYLDQWYAIHEKRMHEIGANPLPRKLFEGIRQNVIGEGCGIFAYALDEGRLIGGAVCVGLNRVMDYFMGSFDSAYVKNQPNSLLMYEMVRYAKGHAYQYWNWQSGGSPHSGLYHYKAGWGSQDGRHYYFTRVIEDITELKKVPVPIVKERYHWHYVMPYEEFVTRP